MAKKKNKWFSWRMALSVLTLGLVGLVVYQNREGFIETFQNLNQANIFVILLLVPEQLFMYYAYGQIFFTYLEGKYHMKFERAELRESGGAGRGGGRIGVSDLSFEIVWSDGGASVFLVYFSVCDYDCSELCAGVGCYFDTVCDRRGAR